MRVLIACEFSGIVREAFRKRGHDAWSCDLEAAEDLSKHHFQGHVEWVLDKWRDWDLMIAHPPCTYLCNSGVRWLKDNPERHAKMLLAVHFFRSLLDSYVPKVCIENPIMHWHAKQPLGWKYEQIVQPWQFGHGETKATCLWLKNLPRLVPTNIVEGRHGRVWREPPGPERWKNRSRTLQGVADAMASQWGAL